MRKLRANELAAVFFKRNTNRGARGESHNAIAQEARAYVAGMNISKINTPTKTQITFTADSGATDHIVNKGIILSEFKQCTGEVIRSANKIGNIVIDGKGNLILRSNINKDNEIILKNVISGEDISENLISLSQFADLGFGIYLDDETLKYF